MLWRSCTRFHRKGDVGRLGAGGGSRATATRSAWRSSGAVLRLAEQLERSRDQSVRSVRVRRVDGGVRLEPVARGDVTVAVWAARQHADALERAVGLPVEVADPVGAPESEPSGAPA